MPENRKEEIMFGSIINVVKAGIFLTHLAG